MGGLPEVAAGAGGAAAVAAVGFPSMVSAAEWCGVVGAGLARWPGCAVGVGWSVGLDVVEVDGVAGGGGGVGEDVAAGLGHRVHQPGQLAGGFADRLTVQGGPVGGESHLGDFGGAAGGHGLGGRGQRRPRVEIGDLVRFGVLAGGHGSSLVRTGVRDKGCLGFVGWVRGSRLASSLALLAARPPGLGKLDRRGSTTGGSTSGCGTSHSSPADPTHDARGRGNHPRTMSSRPLRVTSIAAGKASVNDPITALKRPR